MNSGMIWMVAAPLLRAAGGTDSGTGSVPTLANPMFWIVVGIIVGVAFIMVAIVAIMKKKGDKEREEELAAEAAQKNTNNKEGK